LIVSDERVRFDAKQRMKVIVLLSLRINGDMPSPAYTIQDCPMTPALARQVTRLLLNDKP
jgi:hypothetical protein